MSRFKTPSGRFLVYSSSRSAASSSQRGLKSDLDVASSGETAAQTVSVQALPSPDVYIWKGERWSPASVHLQAPEKGLNLEVLSLVMPDQSPASIEQFVRQQKASHEISIWPDELVTGLVPMPGDGGPTPEEGDPAPEEGDPAPEEGDPAPEEGDPAPEEGDPAPDMYRWSLRITPSPGRVKATHTFQQQYVFWRSGFIAAQKHGIRETGQGVTIFILDAFPFFDGQLDADGTFLDVFVNFVTDEAIRPSPTRAALTEQENCPFVERPRVSRQLATDPDRLAFADVLPYHGMLVASLIRHLAPKARLIGVRVINNYGATFTSDLVRAIDWVLSQPEVDGQPLCGDEIIFNLSLSLRRTQKEIVESCAMFYAVHTAAEQGCWFVCAAGNDSDFRPENPVEPAAYGYYSDSRATARHVIPVAGTHKPTAYARFSNEGVVGALATGVVMDPGPSRFKRNVLHGGYVRWHGTSFATPQVTGLLALLLSRQKPPEDPKQFIWEHAHPPKRWNGVREICFARALTGAFCQAVPTHPAHRRREWV